MPKESKSLNRKPTEEDAKKILSSYTESLRARKTRTVRKLDLVTLFYTREPLLHRSAGRLCAAGRDGDHED